MGDAARASRGPEPETASCRTPVCPYSCIFLDTGKGRYFSQVKPQTPQRSILAAGPETRRLRLAVQPAACQVSEEVWGIHELHGAGCARLGSRGAPRLRISLSRGELAHAGFQHVAIAAARLCRTRARGAVGLRWLSFSGCTRRAALISVKHPKREEGTWVSWRGRTGAAEQRSGMRAGVRGSRGGRFPLSPGIRAVHSLGKRAHPRPKAVFQKQRGQPGQRVKDSCVPKCFGACSFALLWGKVLGSWASGEVLPSRTSVWEAINRGRQGQEGSEGTGLCGLGEQPCFPYHPQSVQMHQWVSGIKGAEGLLCAWQSSALI